MLITLSVVSDVTSQSSHAFPISMDAYENIRYWEQVRHPHAPEMMAEEKQKRRRRNFRLVAYCVVAMMLSIGAHAVLFK